MRLIILFFKKLFLYDVKMLNPSIITFFIYFNTIHSFNNRWRDILIYNYKVLYIFIQAIPFTISGVISSYIITHMYKTFCHGGPIYIIHVWNNGPPLYIYIMFFIHYIFYTEKPFAMVVWFIYIIHVSNNGPPFYIYI